MTAAGSQRDQRYSVRTPPETGRNGSHGASGGGDLKPANIFLLDESGHPELVKIVDFGLAKPLIDSEAVDPEGALRAAELSLAETDSSAPGQTAADHTLGSSPTPSERRASASLGGSGETLSDTTPGSLVGTPRYMAPEQTLGALADERADQYALYW